MRGAGLSPWWLCVGGTSSGAHGPQSRPHVDLVAVAPGLKSTGTVAVQARVQCVGASGSEIGPVSSALTSRLLTTEPPGKPPPHFLSSLLSMDAWVASVSWLL